MTTRSDIIDMMYETLTDDLTSAEALERARNISQALVLADETMVPFGIGDIAHMLEPIADFRIGIADGKRRYYVARQLLACYIIHTMSSNMMRWAALQFWCGMDADEASEWITKHKTDK